MKNLLTSIYTYLFYRITPKSLRKLGFKLSEGKDGSYVMGEYEIPNQKDITDAKFRIYPATGTMLYLTNVSFDNLKSTQTLTAIIEWDRIYQESKTK